MRKLLSLAVLLVCFTLSASAQDTDSRGEFFVGYSVLRAGVVADFADDELGGFDDNELRTLSGVNASATGYFTERVGLTGDFSAHFKSAGESAVLPGAIVCVQAPCNDVSVSAEVKVRTFNFLGGPQVRFSNSTRVTPFVRALAGVQSNRVSANINVSGFNGNNGFGGINNFSETLTDFALGIGGGLDVRVSPRVSVRAIQIDYNPVFLRGRDNLFDSGERFEGERIDNVRFSFGIVFK